MALAKFGKSAHQLRIETDRYQKLEDNDRICLLCDSGEIESEIHFLMDYSYYLLFFNLCKKLFQILRTVILKKQF